jgi:hypothetical protein
MEMIQHKNHKRKWNIRYAQVQLADPTQDPVMHVSDDPGVRKYPTAHTGEHTVPDNVPVHADVLPFSTDGELSHRSALTIPGDRSRLSDALTVSMRVPSDDWLVPSPDTVLDTDESALVVAYCAIDEEKLEYVTYVLDTAAVVA